MDLSRALNAHDLERMAKRRLPHGVFEFVVGGTEDNATRSRNRAAFDTWRLAPRMLVDTSSRTLDTTLFGYRYALPLGIAPMGVVAITWFEADLALARAAAATNVPFVLSGMSTIPLERIAAETTAPRWYQAYLGGGRPAIEALVARLLQADYDVLVVTVDAQIAANRENNLRTGFSIPFALSARMIASGLARPGWLVNTLFRTLLTAGVPHFENQSATRGGPIISERPADRHARRDQLDWDDIAWLRTVWPRRLVLKGILRADDARRAADIGADGVIVSNHGGRQLDGAVAALDVLPEIVDAAGDRLAVMFDSGIRRGTDAMKALALGAKFVFAGRAVLFGNAIAGEAGAKHALGILQAELLRDFGLAGCVSVADLDRSLVRKI